MRSFLNDDEVLGVLYELGYRMAGAEHTAEPSDDETSAYADTRHRYRVEEGRLFPTWSEVFELLVALGYSRVEDTAA